MWFYYTGLKYRAGSTYVGTYPDGRFVPKPGLDTDTGAICLAILRRDGFVSLDGDKLPGTLLTQPFNMDGDRLLVNVDATAGELHVEVLDAEGKVRAASRAIAGDQLRGEVLWQDDDLTGLAGAVIRLRFTLRSARLYSYWLEAKGLF